MTTITVTITIDTPNDSVIDYSFDDARLDSRGNLIVSSIDDGDCAFGTFATELRDVIKHELTGR